MEMRTGEEITRCTYHNSLTVIGKKIEDNKNWIAFASTRGKPIYIYANKPLNEETGELEKAQAALNNYLENKGLQPAIVIHRGHSYYAPYTIEQIQPSAKIVFLGSCGGYHLIHNVLQHAPDAHIISSKQIGKEVINRPFIDLINEKLRAGSNIDWMPFWNEFKAKAGKVEGFDDYVSKPVSPSIFVSKVKALFRRVKKPESKILTIDNLIIDPEKFVVEFEGKEIVLAKKEFELLYLLATKPGRVFLRNEILSQVWGNDVIVGDRTIDVHIRKIRQKLGIECITTVKGVGYKFEI